jgi:hypothetical protein
MATSSTLRLAMAVVGLLVLPDEQGPASEGRCTPEGRPGARVLLHVAGSGTLSRRYGLGVTGELPAPPPLEGRPEPAWGRVCPVEVRAVVEAESAADSFAVLATGADSRIVRVGQGFRAGGGLLSVAAIEPGRVLLRAGEKLVSCDFVR